MIKKSSPQRIRTSVRKKSGKVPLTYYRSASGKTNGDKSPFVRNKPKSKLKKYLFGILDLLFITLLLVFFFYSLIVAPIPSISASTYTYHPAQVYKQAAERELKSFSSRNKLTIDEKQIIKKLQQIFPEIVGGNVELPVISQTPKIHLNISEPAFVLKSSNGSYIINSNGIVVGEASNFPAFKKLPIVEDHAIFKLQKGSPALSTSSTKFIKNVWHYSQKTNLAIASMILPALPMELNLKTADKPYIIKFYLGGDAALQTGQFLAARKQFEKDNINPQEYLDVRVQGKIFYK